MLLWNLKKKLSYLPKGINQCYNKGILHSFNRYQQRNFQNMTTEKTQRKEIFLHKFAGHMNRGSLYLGKTRKIVLNFSATVFQLCQGIHFAGQFLLKTKKSMFMSKYRQQSLKIWKFSKSIRNFKSNNIIIRQLNSKHS